MSIGENGVGTGHAVAVARIGRVFVVESGMNFQAVHYSEDFRRAGFGANGIVDILVGLNRLKRSARKFSAAQIVSVPKPEDFVAVAFGGFAVHSFVLEII